MLKNHLFLVKSGRGSRGDQEGTAVNVIGDTWGEEEDRLALG